MVCTSFITTGRARVPYYPCYSEVRLFFKANVEPPLNRLQAWKPGYRYNGPDGHESRRSPWRGWSWRVPRGRLGLRRWVHGRTIRPRHEGTARAWASRPRHDRGRGGLMGGRLGVVPGGCEWNPRPSPDRGETRAIARAGVGRIPVGGSERLGDRQGAEVPFRACTSQSPRQIGGYTFCGLPQLEAEPRPGPVRPLPPERRSRTRTDDDAGKGDSRGYNDGRRPETSVPAHASKSSGAGVARDRLRPARCGSGGEESCQGTISRSLRPQTSAQPSRSIPLAGRCEIGRSGRAGRTRRRGIRFATGRGP